MRFVPGIIFALMAVALYGYNASWPHQSINLPFLEVFLERGTRAQRGELTWQVVAAVALVLLVGGLVLQLVQPRAQRP